MFPQTLMCQSERSISAGIAGLQSSILNAAKPGGTNPQTGQDTEYQQALKGGLA
ncbi:MAG: hypothetical protein L0H54_00235 [Alcaligenaceae bacterium]|nr:hypothetical protein [Alcaligenaceae bacterium]